MTRSCASWYRGRKQARVLAEGVAGVHRRADREARDEASARDAVEHGELFRDPGRWVVEGEAVAHDADRGIFGAPREGRGDEVRRRHEPVAVGMVLVHAHPVEAALGGELELVHEVVVHVVGPLRIEQARVDVHPHGRILFPEVVRQLGIGHQVEPEQLHVASSIVGARKFMFAESARAPQPAPSGGGRTGLDRTGPCEHDFRRYRTTGQDPRDSGMRPECATRPTGGPGRGGTTGTLRARRTAGFVPRVC